MTDEQRLVRLIKRKGLAWVLEGLAEALEKDAQSGSGDKFAITLKLADSMCSVARRMRTKWWV